MDTPASPCTCFQLRRAARRVSQLYDRHLAAAGLSLNAYSILRRARQARPLGELADALGMDRTTLSRNLKPLVNAGLLAMQAGRDPRQRQVRLTAQGEQRLQQAQLPWRQAQDEIESLFGSAAIAGLNRQLEALYRALEPENPA